MNKKKGFTLIELLAIIVILAIIAVITVPLILGIINDAQKNASIDSAYGYKDALEKYYITKTVKNTEYESPNGYKNISELPEDFIVSGESPSEGWVKLKKGMVDRFSLKYGEYVVTMDNNKNVISEKQETVEPHIIGNYQEVEYLESTGTQYIDTGIKGESKWQITNQYTTPSDASQILVGCGSSAGQWFGQNSKKYAIGVDSSYVYNISSQTKEDLLIEFTTTKVSSTLEQITKNRPGSLTGNNYYLFGGLSSGSGNFYSYTQIYKAKVYQNNNVVRRFVPVVRKSDNKPGMLDLANLSNNLFNYENDVVLSVYIDDSNGIQKNQGSSASTNYIYIKPNTYYYISPISSGNWGAWYDENKEFIEGIHGYGVKQSPANAKYARFTINYNNSNTDYANTFMIAESREELPYEPYIEAFYTNAGTGEFITGPEI